jgi:hypothetical protein
MAYYGNFKDNKFNESNPFFLRRRAKEEARKKWDEEQKIKAEEAEKNPPVEDITNDT